MKDRDLELRVLQDVVAKLDPTFFSQNLCAERLRDGCSDCKQKEAKLAGMEEHNRSLTDYIKKSSERLGEEKKKYEVEVSKLRKEMLEQQMLVIQKANQGRQEVEKKEERKIG